jgi:hypothetical protein
MRPEPDGPWPARAEHTLLATYLRAGRPAEAHAFIHGRTRALDEALERTAVRRWR